MDSQLDWERRITFLRRDSGTEGAPSPHSWFHAHMVVEISVEVILFTEMVAFVISVIWTVRGK